MAVVTIVGIQVGGTPFTVRIDNSGDYAGVANDTRFLNKTDGLVYFKNSYGNIVSPFTAPPPNVQTVTSSATVTAVSTDDLVSVTAQAAALTIANPTGTFANGQILNYRIKGDGTAWALTLDTKFVAYGSAFPATLSTTKTLLLSCQYNSVLDKFETLNSLEQ